MFDEKTKPKPTKIAEILANNEKLGLHSNLLVFGRKEDMIDKETEIGRWKIIEAVIGTTLIRIQADGIYLLLFDVFALRTSQIRHVSMCRS